MRIIFNYIVVLLLLLASCANPLPPSGGPPDTSPPEILKTEPANGSLNFRDGSVYIKFNKYMDKNSMNENVYISPSLKTKLSWSGKELEIEFLDTPDSNTTYSINLGTEYSDIYRNKPDKAFALIFSTGNEIDSGSVRGVLYDKEPSGVFIYAYRIDNINPDTLNPSHTKPKYKVQVGSKGTFEIKALKEGTYRLFAVRDKFKNELIDDLSDDFGTTSKDAVVRKDTTPEVIMRIGPPIDRAKPVLYSADAPRSNKIITYFTEDLDTNTVSVSAFSVVDSIDKTPVILKSAYLSENSGKKIELITGQNLDTTRRYEISALADTAVCIRDLKGNIISDTSKTIIFKPVDSPDSTLPLLVQIPLKDSVRNALRNPVFRFVFNIGVESSSIAALASLYKLSDSSQVEMEYQWKQDNILEAYPKQQLANISWYSLVYKSASLTGLNGIKSRDTVLKSTFETIDTRTYATVGGKVIDSLGSDGPFIIFLNSTEGKSPLSTITDSYNNWKINEVPPGKYKIEVVVDSNKNGKYDYGRPYPYEKAERFFLKSEELAVKPRWSIEDLIIKLTN